MRTAVCSWATGEGRMLWPLRGPSSCLPGALGAASELRGFRAAPTRWASLLSRARRCEASRAFSPALRTLWAERERTCLTQQGGNTKTLAQPHAKVIDLGFTAGGLQGLDAWPLCCRFSVPPAHAFQGQPSKCWVTVPTTACDQQGVHTQRHAPSKMANRQAGGATSLQPLRVAGCFTKACPALRRGPGCRGPPARNPPRLS